MSNRSRARVTWRDLSKQATPVGRGRRGRPHVDVPLELCERVRIIRRGAGITLKQVADIAGTCVSSLSLWERTGYGLSREVVEAIFRFFEIDYDFDKKKDVAE